MRGALWDGFIVKNRKNLSFQGGDVFNLLLYGCVEKEKVGFVLTKYLFTSWQNSQL